ncbi:hypothetical protein GCM10010994_23800 [Chelatococcus reniformis]|uniref:Ferritin/DPS domain-containing protein n=2 Tax=Chelatococcus reniformis TaxID=1494448 RepID=A0A916U8R6_9HYPH|nr:hypothetical protein GCM10010994_23800 [Chelatococcus reniformis]
MYGAGYNRTPHQSLNNLKVTAMAKASTPKGSPARPPAARRAAAKPPAKKSSAVAPSRVAPNRLDTPTDLSPEAVLEISDALKALLADTFTLYIKTKNFHWHVSGPHFRDYHLLLDEQAEQIFESTDDLAERARKIGGTTLRSIGQIAKLSRISDNEAEYVDPRDMLLELVADNKAMVASLREAHGVADKHEDFATTSLIENFIDATERRTWFLFEASRRADNTGH